MSETPIEWGSPEWYKQLKEIVTFPAKVAFYYDQKEDVVHGYVVESKARHVDGVRYGFIKPGVSWYHSKDNTALLDVVMINDAEHYYDKVVILRDIWKRGDKA